LAYNTVPLMEKLQVGKIREFDRLRSRRPLRKNVMKMISLVIIALLLTGCATVTGTVTGAFTGALDLPVETYRANPEFFHDSPIAYGFDALIMGPVGLVLGPVMGFFKGLSLDIQWVAQQVSYRDVFGSYQPQSIWRPHTLHWELLGVGEGEE